MYTYNSYSITAANKHCCTWNLSANGFISRIENVNALSSTTFNGSFSQVLHTPHQLLDTYFIPSMSFSFKMFPFPYNLSSLSSSFIHFHPFSSIFIHFHPFSSSLHVFESFRMYLAVPGCTWLCLGLF